MNKCELCQPKSIDVLWKNKLFYVLDAKDKQFPGFIRVVSIKHIKEMSELEREERLCLLDILVCLEKLMIKTMQPEKVNYAQFGNMTPHLHWHLIPRYQDDDKFPESPWGINQRQCPLQQLERREQLAQAFFAEIPQVLSREFNSDGQ